MFVALDDGPPHPVFPGVGFIPVPHLSWQRIETITDVVQVGERITCSFICPDDHHGEATLSLRDLRPDPWEEFLAGHVDGRSYQGTVTTVVPFGVFVRIADGIEGAAARDVTRGRRPVDGLGRQDRAGRTPRAAHPR